MNFIDYLTDMLILLGRIITIIPLMLITTLIMGKRSIGELPVFDFLIVITLGAVVGADIADPKIEHIHTAVAIVLIGLFQFILTKYKLRNRAFGRLITFEPTLVVHNGKLLKSQIRHIRYSIDNILQMLREKDIFDIDEVEAAIVEANGRLTVLKKPDQQTVTLKDIGKTKDKAGFSYPVLLEGTIYTDVLKRLNLTEEWLIQELKGQGVTDLRDVFFASITDQREVRISLNLESAEYLPPLHH